MTRCCDKRTTSYSFNALKEKRGEKGESNRGASLILAIIIIMILIVFTFSLMLIAYTLYASQNKNISSLKCSEAANSLSVALDDELTYEDETNNIYPEIESYLYRYIRYNICQDDKTWPYYVDDNKIGHDKKAAYRYFNLKFNSSKPVYDSDGNVIKKKDSEGNDTDANQTLDSVEGLPGNTTVCIYWKLPKGVDPDSVGTVKEDFKSIDKRKGIRLFIEVTSESASQSYTVKREYKLDIEDYNMTNAEDKLRFNYLKKAGVVDEPSVNPLNLKMSDGTNGVEDDLYYGEKWTWIPVEE